MRFIFFIQFSYFLFSGCINNNNNNNDDDDGNDNNNTNGDDEYTCIDSSNSHRCGSQKFILQCDNESRG